MEARSLLHLVLVKVVFIFFSNFQDHDKTVGV